MADNIVYMNGKPPKEEGEQDEPTAFASVRLDDEKITVAFTGNALTLLGLIDCLKQSILEGSQTEFSHIGTED